METMVENLTTIAKVLFNKLFQHRSTETFSISNWQLSNSNRIKEHSNPMLSGLSSNLTLSATLTIIIKVSLNLTLLKLFVLDTVGH